MFMNVADTREFIRTVSIMVSFFKQQHSTRSLRLRDVSAMEHETRRRYLDPRKFDELRYNEALSLLEILVTIACKDHTDRHLESDAPPGTWNFINHETLYLLGG